MSQHLKIRPRLIRSTSLPVLYSLSSIICWSVVKVKGRVVKWTNITNEWGGKSGSVNAWIKRPQWVRVVQIVCRICSRKGIYTSNCGSSDRLSYPLCEYGCWGCRSIMESWSVLCVVYCRTKDLRVTGWTAHWNVLIGSHPVTYEHERA
jgi:hypothetical protein